MIFWIILRKFRLSLKLIRWAWLSCVLSSKIDPWSTSIPIASDYTQLTSLRKRFPHLKVIICVFILYSNLKLAVSNLNYFYFGKNVKSCKVLGAFFMNFNSRKWFIFNDRWYHFKTSNSIIKSCVPLFQWTRTFEMSSRLVWMAPGRDKNYRQSSMTNL